jgi:hypothetical protein
MKKKKIIEIVKRNQENDIASLIEFLEESIPDDELKEFEDFGCRDKDCSLYVPGGVHVKGRDSCKYA